MTVRSGAIALGVAAALFASAALADAPPPPPPADPWASPPQAEAGQAASTPPPPPATSGRLMIISAPAGAEVWVDGARAGTAPLRWEAVTAGKHTLTFRLAGYEELTAEVAVTAGGEAVALHKLRPAPVPAPSRYGERWRAHVGGWAAGLSLGYLGSTMTDTARARTGLEGGGGFSFDLFGRVSLVEFGGDATFTPFSDPMPEWVATDRGSFPSGLSGVTVSGWAGPSIPIGGPLFLAAHGGYVAVPEGITRKTEVPENTICIGCLHMNHPIKGGPFAEANVSVRYNGFAFAVGYRRLLGSDSDLSSMLSVKLSAYLDPQVFELLNALGRK